MCDAAPRGARLLPGRYPVIHARQRLSGTFRGPGLDRSAAPRPGPAPAGGEGR